MKKDKILTYLHKHKIAKTSELLPILGNKVAIIRLADTGVIQQVVRGYYILPGLDIFTGLLILVAKYYSYAVVSGLMAARFYEITDENIDRIDVDMVNSRNIINDFMRVKRIEPKRLIGVKTISIQGYALKIYNLERVLIDIYLKYERGIFYKILKRAQKNYAINVDLIKQYDEILKTNVLESIMQERADA